MEDYNYDTLSSTIKIEDITSSKSNQDILRRLKENDIKNLWICDELLMDEITTDGDKCDYVALNNEDAMGWLGYFISKSKSLKEFHFLDCYINNIEDLFRGINNNRSLKNIGFYQDINTLEGNIFGMLDPFFKNNHKLIEVVVQNCELRAEGVRLLSLDRELQIFETLHFCK